MRLLKMIEGLLCRLPFIGKVIKVTSILNHMSASRIQVTSMRRHGNGYLACASLAPNSRGLLSRQQMVFEPEYDSSYWSAGLLALPSSTSHDLMASHNDYAIVEAGAYGYLDEVDRVIHNRMRRYDDTLTSFATVGDAGDGQRWFAFSYAS